MSQPTIPVTSYVDLDGFNWSSLKHIYTSPLLYRHRIDHPEPDTNVFAFGSCAHTAALEPGKLESRFAPYEGQRSRRDGEPVGKYKEWVEGNPGVRALRPHEYEHAKACAAALRDHPEAIKWITGGRAEVVTQWVEPVSEVKAKGRIDYLRGRVIDIKTTTDVSEHKIGTAAARYLYHGQLAWYHVGAITANLIPANAPPPIIISVEKEPPHDVACDELSWEDLAAGKDLYLTLVHRLLACIETKTWPGKAPSLRQLKLPAWAPGLGEEWI